MLGDFDEAERHFEAAAAIEHRMRARPWIAHVHHDLAVMLVTRGRAPDRQRAATLVQEAVAIYNELGMDRWAERARALVSDA